MRQRRTMWVLAACLAVWTIPQIALGQSADEPQVRLVVVIVIDQFRGDYVTRFERHFGPDGFRRLIGRGAFFANTYFSYNSTTTASGHASISTGRIPRQHGIVANGWFHQDEPAVMRRAVHDPDCRNIGPDSPGADGGYSPRWLIGPGLGDQIKLSDRRSRVFAVSVKPRASIMLGGKRPDGAFWFDSSCGRFCTSTYYTEQLPPYVADFNQQRWADRFAGRTWDRVLPAADYEGCYPLTAGAPAEHPEDHAFSHRLPDPAKGSGSEYYARLCDSPFGNQLVLEMARRILADEKLGTDEAVDLLGISLSSNDHVGHLYGPQSAEVLDCTVRTDRQIAELLALLDDTVGPGRYLLALTGDHGVTAASSLTSKLGLGGGRIEASRLTSELNDLLNGKFGTPEAGASYVVGVKLPWVHFGPAFEALPRSRASDLLDDAVSFLRDVEGIADVIRAEELAGPVPSPDDGDRYLTWRSYYPGRSGELYLQLEPYWSGAGGDVAGHSLGTSHDRHVPLVFYGPGVRPGLYLEPARPIDLAVTLAALLSIEAPLNATGRVLHEALVTSDFSITLPSLRSR